MCSITGYGLTGPGRDRAAFDANIQAYAGIMGLTGDPDGMPVRAAPAYADLCAGMAGALGILAAVVARERSGRGQHVDLAMFDVQLSMQNYYCTMELASVRPPRRLGSEHELHVPYNVYPTASGPLCVTVVTEAQWSGLLRALGRLDHPPELREHLEMLADARLRKRTNRIAARAAINAAMAAILATRPREQWMQALAAERLPFAPVNTLAEALADPQTAARGMVARIPLPDGGTCPASGNPIKLSDAGPDTYTPPPTIGQHTPEVLANVLGYDEARVARLLKSGAFTAAADRAAGHGPPAGGGARPPARPRRVARQAQHEARTDCEAATRRETAARDVGSRPEAAADRGAVAWRVAAQETGAAGGRSDDAAGGDGTRHGPAGEGSAPRSDPPDGAGGAASNAAAPGAATAPGPAFPGAGG